VLSEGRKVAATPANMNVAISHARFARTLEGDEDVLILEYGEGKPGDISRFAELTHPTDAVVTGLAPAHLDKYKTLAAAGLDIFSVRHYVMTGHVYVNRDSPATHDFMSKDMLAYDAKEALGWSISGIKISSDGTAFTMKQGKHKLRLQSGLLGRHQVGPLAFAAAFGLRLGMTDKQVEAGVAKVVPFEHRMQPYAMNGATIIDDTYNGNLEGVRAGTALLHELPAKRKMYVTPGLVDQGRDAARIHVQLGELIAAAKPDTVVLMLNSVTEYIEAGLESGGYKGDVRVVTDPLQFYNNLKFFVAAGDLVLMQNDWTDNYA
jgi:UDP-N-acetylmuramoyl-tripeptide--D-alanyl-D-alanine ligase